MVVTVALKAEAADALMGTLAGTEHVAPVGAPEQVSVAVPLKPWPPMARAQVAIAPAVTVVEAEPPEGKPNPIFGPELLPPVPVRATDCGLPVALSTMVRVPVCDPEATNLTGAGKSRQSLIYGSAVSELGELLG